MAQINKTSTPGVSVDPQYVVRENRQEEDSKLDYRITVLGEDNYITWKWQITMILKNKGMYDSATKDEGDALQKGRAATFLASTLSQDNMRRVINCDSAYQIWTTLEANYENKSSTERTMLLEKFTSAKIYSIKSLGKDIGEIQALAAKLRNLGVTVDDEFIISIILKALPESLRAWKSTWKIVNAKEPNLNNLISSIFAEVSEMKVPQDSALVARNKPWERQKEGNFQPRKFSKSRFSKNGPDKTGNRTCYYCNKPGHWISECAKKLADEKRSGNEGIAMMAIETDTSPESGLWIADSGSSFHMTSNLDWINGYEEFKEEKQITLGDNRCIPAKGSGNIKTKFGILLDVHYVPELSSNLFSISAAASKGIEARYNNEGIKLLKDNREIMSGSRDQGTYWLNMEITKNYAAAATLKEWHNRLGHIAPKTIERMAKLKIVEGLEIKPGPDSIECIECALGKCNHASHSTRSTPRVNTPGTSLHFDTVGPSKIESLAGSKYILLCKDEASGYRLASMITSKDQIPDKLKLMISKAEIETGNRVLQIKSDNGSEFINSTVKEFIIGKGINHITSIAYTPQQNGIIERDIRTVIEAARTMLNSAHLPTSLWAEAVDTAIYVLNRTPSIFNRYATSYELWFGKKPNLGNIHRFGQNAVVKYTGDHKSKWDEKGSIQKFVGYTEIFNTFKFFDEESATIYRSCDAKFIDQSPEESAKHLDGQWIKDEIVALDSIVPRNKPANMTMFSLGEMEWDNETTVFHEIDDLNSELTENESEEFMDKVSTHADAGTETDEMECGEKRRRKYNKLDRLKKLTDKLGPSDIHPLNILDNTLRPTSPRTYHAKLAAMEAEEDPRCFNEILQRKDKEQWLQAMEEEMQSLKKNEVYTLVDRPQGNIVTNKWVFKVKRRPDGTVERYKARLVARGFSQVHGIDYLETYAPVANMTSIRLLLAYAAVEKLEIAQFDVKTAFLYGELDETVYMEQPEGFCKDKSKVCLLNRSLYGLKQSPRQWNLKFSQFLKDMNLRVSQHDGCIFYKTDPLLIIAIYVDDGLIFSRSEEEISKTINQLSERFDIHLEEATAFLGFQVHRGTSGEIALHQTSYIKTILKRFNMEDSKPVDSPISPTSGSIDDEPLDKSVPYREAIGSLMYAAVITRIDIAHAVNKASRHVQNPTNQDWIAVKRIFRYLRGRESFSLVYRATKDKTMTVFCDADFAGDIETSRSTTGSVFLFGGAPVLWKSQRQSLITLSSTEAEYVSICSTVKDTIWLRKLGQELKILTSKPTVIFCDNQSAIRIATNEKSVHRTRHMSVQANYPREQIEEGEIEIKHVKADDQLADMLTKPTSVQKFAKNREKLMQTIVTSVCCICMLGLCMNSVIGYKFDQVGLMVASKTPIEVETGTTKYEIELTYTSPCSKYLTREMEEKYTTSGHNQIATLRGKCTEKYTEVWEKKLDELLTTPIPSRTPQIGFNQLTKRSITESSKVLKRYKRIDPFTVIFSGVVLGILVVYNIVNAALSEVLPWGDGVRIRSLESRAEIDQKRIAELETKVNRNIEVERNLEESLNKLAQQVRNNTANIERMSASLINLIWVGSFLQTSITNAGNRLENMRTELMKGRAATLDMYELWNVTQFRNIPPEDTMIENLERISSHTVSIRLFVKNRSKDTHVYEMFAFETRRSKGGTPIQLRYTGPKHFIGNTTNRCVKSISLDAGDTSVQEECRTPGQNHPLDTWAVTKIEDLSLYPLPVVKQINPYNFIYCEGYNITIDEFEVPCPNYPFKLPTTKSFATINHHYTGSTRKVSAERFWPNIELDFQTNSIDRDIFHRFEHEEHYASAYSGKTPENNVQLILIVAIVLLVITLISIVGMAVVVMQEKYKRLRMTEQGKNTQIEMPLISRPITRIEPFHDQIYSNTSDISEISNNKPTRVKLMSRDIPLTQTR